MKINDKLATLLIREIATVSGMSFKRPDRLSRAEVAQVMSWAQSTPEIAAAFRSGKGNQAHATVQLYRSMLDHFAEAHPQSADGEPSPWPSRGPRPPATPTNPAGLFPDEAEAILAWAPTSSEYLSIYHSADHPEHATYVELTQNLHQLAAAPALEASGAAAPPVPDGSSAPSGAMDTAALRRLEELRSSPSFLNKSDPLHNATIAEISALYEGAQRGAAAPAAPGAAVRTPLERIASLKDSEAYFDRSHPLHAVAVQEATEAFATAYPEPAPAAGGR